MATVDDTKADQVACNLEESAPIEVERKFVFFDDTEQKIIDLGGSLVAHKTFHDDYYDTPDYRLTLSDYWLRQRDGQWELKCPPALGQSDLTATQYAEFTNEDQIIYKLLQIFDDSPTGNNQATSILALTAQHQCRSFASFTTERKSYSLDNFLIDLDSADFGFKVGEIEAMVASENGVADAIQKINQLAHKLEMKLLGEAGVPIFPTSGMSLPTPTTSQLSNPESHSHV